MTTTTHLSHFGLTKIAETDTGIVFDGTLAACKRMAAAHGMKIERYEGAVMGMDGGHATFAPANETHPLWIMYRDGGLIQKGRAGYTLVMPLAVWTRA